MLGLGLGLGASVTTGAATPTPTPTESLSGFTSNNITFTLAAARDVGQYASGDYFVVIPEGGNATLTEATPVSALLTGTFAGGASYTNEIFHGLMTNPAQGSNGWASEEQGWNSIQVGDTPAPSSTIQPFNAALNKDPAIAGNLTVTGPTTAVKLKQDTTPPDDGRTGLTTDMALLTFVSEVPTIDSFRPSGRETDKASYFTTSDLNISFLPNVAAVGTPPTYAALLAQIQKPYQTFFTNGLFTRGFSPINQQEGYGRDIAGDIEEVLLALCTDALTGAQKTTLATYAVQLGLDILNAAKDGATWALPSGSYGGGQHWVKPVAIFAAYALRNAGETTKAAELLAWVDPAQHIFAPEDRTFKLVDRLQIETYPLQRSGQDHIPYFDYMENAPMWNSKPSSPDQTGSAWRQVYRTNVAGTSLAACLALRMMGIAGPAYVSPFYAQYLDFLWDWSKIETWTVDNPTAWKEAMLDAYLPTYSASYSDSAAPTLVRVVARGEYVWFEFDKLLSRRFIPASSAYAVTVNGSPATIVSASDQYTTEPFTNRSPDIYGKSMAVRLATPVAEGDTVTIAYTKPGSNQARTLGGGEVASIAATAATNMTGVLPDPAASIDTVRSTEPRATRQVSGTSAPASETIDWMQFSARFRIHSITANDTIISNSSTGTTAFWLYWSSTAALRFYLGVTSADRIDIGSASTNLPLDTEITMHVYVDYTQLDEADMFKIHFAWDGGSWTPTIGATARSATTPNMANIFNGGVHFGGASTRTDRSADMSHKMYLLRWGLGSTPAVPNFADPQFAWNAAWGDNGENVWGQPQLYYAGTLAEWNGAVPNRGNYGANALVPKLIDPATEELISEYVEVLP